MKKPLLFFSVFFALPVLSGLGEITVLESERYSFTFSPSARTSVITLENTLDLDSSNDQDSTTYLSIFYSLDFDWKFKDDGPEFFAQMTRYGPWYYDAPVSIHNTLATSVAPVSRYRDAELLPSLTQYWADIPLGNVPLRFKGGLFTYEVGNNISVGTGYYENYGAGVHVLGEGLSYGIYYFRPDLSHQLILGPRVPQEEEQGVTGEPNAANMVAGDIQMTFGSHRLQPYVSVLIDRLSPEKKDSVFAAPVGSDTLGTAGIAWTFEETPWWVTLELARNFGQGLSDDPSFKDIEHKGFLAYAAASYQMGRWTPNVRCFFATGNKVDPQAAASGDDTLSGGANRAFSVFSPLNYNLADSLYSGTDARPLLAMGWGYGLNYGIDRPTTAQDPGLFDNLIMPSLGLDYEPIEALTLSVSWWYLWAQEPGAGTFEGNAIKLSQNLGHEIDFSVSYEFNDVISLALYSGFFFPGRYYEELRDDEAGSLLTPFVRGDGDADIAYQIELAAEIQF